VDDEGKRVKSASFGGFLFCSLRAGLISYCRFGFFWTLVPPSLWTGTLD
jgi:hypothetical protein